MDWRASCLQAFTLIRCVRSGASVPGADVPRTVWQPGRSLSTTRGRCEQKSESVVEMAGVP